jgi:hypothetical protein
MMGALISSLTSAIYRNTRYQIPEDTAIFYFSLLCEKRAPLELVLFPHEWTPYTYIIILRDTFENMSLATSKASEWDMKSSRLCLWRVLSSSHVMPYMWQIYTNISMETAVHTLRVKQREKMTSVFSFETSLTIFPLHPHIPEDIGLQNIFPY